MTVWAGSLDNRLMDGAKQKTPEVGMGATEILYTDRHPYTIIEVNEKKTRIVVQQDNAKRIDNNGMSETQCYEYSPNPEARKRVLTLRKTGQWIEKGESLKGNKYLIDYREEYRDYSF